MKRITNIILALFVGLFAYAQGNDLVVTGTVVDVNGNTVANAEVCAYSDSTSGFVFWNCVSTDANGNYNMTITDGSVTGPNVDFYFYLNESCGPNWLPPPPTQISNMQGTVDVATADFVSCASGSGGGCDVTITVQPDSTNPNGFWLTATASGNGPFTYMWDNGTTTQTAYYISNGIILWDGCVTVIDADSCTATACDASWQNGGGGNCSVDITTTQNPADSTSFTMTANPVGGTGPYTFYWEPGGLTTQTVTMNFNQIDVACVTVTDANNCVAFACDTVYPGGCFADFWLWGNNPNGAIEANDTVQAYFNGSFESGNTYVWTVTGGGVTMTYTGQNPWMYFPTAGVYTVCVTVDNGNGCSDTYCDDITVTNGNSGNCGVTITSVMDSIPGGTVYVLTANATGTPPFNYIWSTGEIGQQITYSPSPIFGDTICVTITDADGCTSTACDVIDGNNGSCQAAFYSYIDSTCMLPLDCYQFVDYSSGLNTQAVSWVWDLGDGTVSTDQNPMHAYSQWGTYNVCLTVTMSDGCVSTTCDQITVGGGSGNCDATFTSSGPTPIGYTFSALTLDSNLTYQWEMNGVVLGNGWEYYSPGFAPGTYTICLTVFDNANCWDQYCMTFTVPGGPCEGYISGMVNAGSPNFPLDEGIVYLITYDSVTNMLTAVDSTYLDTMNYYFFGPVPCGDYLVKAAATPNSAYYSDHIPTYFGNSPFWDFAETVTIDEVNIQVTTDITLISGANPGGPGFIGGDVTEGANKFGDIGDPVIGATVLLFDNTSNVISYVYTDANGEFGFDNLPWGTYQVYVEMLNKTTTPVIVTIGPDQPSFEGVHVLVFDTEITTDVEDIQVVLNSTGLYPNPANSNVSIEFASEATIDLQIIIRDLTGRVVFTDATNLLAGGNKLTIDVSELKDGYYSIEFTNQAAGVKLNEKLIVAGQ